MTQKNNSIIKVSGAVILTIILLVTGWVWKTSTDAKEIAYKLATNEAKDDKDHVELKESAMESHDSIIKIQSDISYIKTGIDEIKQQIKNKP